MIELEKGRNYTSKSNGAKTAPNVTVCGSSLECIQIDGVHTYSMSISIIELKNDYKMIIIWWLTILGQHSHNTCVCYSLMDIRV